MARSKEQWKAQQRAQHTQGKPNTFSQIKRAGGSHLPGGRPQLPPATSAIIFQLGTPTPAAATASAASARPVALKPDPVQMPSVNASASGAAACIDLTLDDDDDEDEDDEDEPMGAQGQSQQLTAPISNVAAASRVPASPPSAIAVTVPPASATTVTASPAATPSSAASDAIKLSMLDGTGNDPTPVAGSLQQIEPASEVMAPMVEDVESDVDEEWPSVPPSVNDQAPAGQTEEDVRMALDAIRKTIPFAQAEQEHEDEEMEADVDEELPSQAPKDGQGSSDSSSTADRIVRVENLEDGEIFEGGAAPKPAIEVQRAIMLEQQGDTHPVDPMEIRPHLRNKKQKKRGKKKTKRKLEAMQMVATPPGEMEPEFERVTRQRPFGDAPPPGPFTYAMMRNGPRVEPVNVRPVFQDPPPASFHPGGMFVGAPHPPMPQMPAPPMPPPPPYEDSRILRVNRQGSMEMLDNEAQMPRSIHPMFAEPPRHGGFKYRSVAVSSPRPAPSDPSHLLHRSVSDTSRLPSRPAPGHDGPANPVASDERNDPDDFDLDSLRAAALRSKPKRLAKNPTSTSEKTIELQSMSSSSTPSPLPEQKQAEPASPEIDKLRLEILRSMQRNRKRTTNKVESKTVPSTPPPARTTATGPLERSSSETAMNGEKAETVGVGKASATDADVNSANELMQPTSEKAAAQPEFATTDGSTCETDKSTTTSELNESGGKGEPSSAECTKAPTDIQVATPEFRPLTACSQSLVIRLSPEDLSPWKGGNGAQAKTTTSSSLQDAIKEMRRKIAEREKAQTMRLLENTAAKLSKTSSDQGSSSSSASSSPSPLDLPPPETKTSVAVSQQPDATAASPAVISSAFKSPEESRPAVDNSGLKTEGTGTDAKQASGTEAKENMNTQELLPGKQQLAETVPGQEPSSVSEEPREPVLESPKRNDTSGSIPTSTVAEGATSCEHATTKKPASPSTPGGNGELDVSAIRAEYEQCVAECEEAEAHIARLSDEMSRLEKQVLPVGSSVEGS